MENNTMETGYVYAFAGVIGGGKSYRMSQLQNQCREEGCELITGDFSEGIRQTILHLITGRDGVVDCNGELYANWKNSASRIYLPTKQFATMVTGRELLQRTGTYLKELAGADVWANWTMRDVLHKYGILSPNAAHTANIAFGSLRFLVEAEAVFKTAKMTSKPVKIIFCDYKSSSYQLNDHESERLARKLLDAGCKDGEDITGKIQDLLKGFDL